MIISDLPFIWRTTAEPDEPPPGVSERMDFTWDWDNRYGLLRQKVTPELREALAAIYKVGSENLGATPQYGERFWQFFLGMCGPRFQNRPVKKTNVLEIGPGSGWMTKRLQQHIDPFVFKGSFPPVDYTQHSWMFSNSSREHRSGDFDVIVAHHVLEHVEDVDLFLKGCATILSSNGLVFLAVPDCAWEIGTGDVSIATHQHLSYFTPRSLAACARAAGLDHVQLYSDGGAIMAAFGRQVSRDDEGYLSMEDMPVHTFGRFCSRAVKNEGIISSLVDRFMGSDIGFYAPMRALPYVAMEDYPFRLFDDGMAGKYLDGVDNQIEGIADFEAMPVDVMFVMSRTYEREIVAKLAGRCKVITLTEMLDV